MADREQSHTSERGMNERPQRDHGVKTGGTVGRDIPDESKERHTEIAVEAGRRYGYGEHRAPERGMEEKPQPDHGVKTGGTVGRDIPDESKERHTEIAVEAGRKYGTHHDDKH